MAECLWEIAQQFAGGRVYLLGEQPNIIDIRDRPLEGRPGSFDLASQSDVKLTLLVAPP